MAEKLYIGWSEADITPVTDKLIPLAGLPLTVHGIHIQGVL